MQTDSLPAGYSALPAFRLPVRGALAALLLGLLVGMLCPSPGLAQEDNGTEVARNLKVDFETLESYGLIDSSEGGLGRDLWLGSTRSALRGLIAGLPASSPYATMQDLARRALLTRPEAGLVRDDERPIPGEDMTTLRIEKLLEVGQHHAALALHNRHPLPPYHERLARAGIIAALYNRQPALACLEEKALGERVTNFEDGIFWGQIDAFCSHFIARSGKDGKPDSETRAAAAAAGSQILERIVGNPNFRFAPRKLDELSDLTPLEAAVLAAEGRLDLSGLAIDKPQTLPPHVISLLLDEASLPESQAFTLAVAATKLGIKSAADLTSFYLAAADRFFGKDKTRTSLAGFRDIAGWRRLPYLHRAVTATQKPEEQASVLAQVFSLAPEYDTAAFRPFAAAINKAGPDGLSPESIRFGFQVLADSNIRISDAWAHAWRTYLVNSGKTDKSAFFDYLAGEMALDTRTENPAQAIDFKHIYENLSPQELAVAIIVYEKLDNTNKLHNYSASDIYEKHSGLTSAVDYVMASISLLESLEQAKIDRRLGEVVLLSSILLHDASAEDLHGGVLKEVTDGLTTVGLTKEARSLIREVMLGLSVK